MSPTALYGADPFDDKNPPENGRGHQHVGPSLRQRPSCNPGHVASQTHLRPGRQRQGRHPLRQPRPSDRRRARHRQLGRRVRPDGRDNLRRLGASLLREPDEPRFLRGAFRHIRPRSLHLAWNRTGWAVWNGSLLTGVIEATYNVAQLYLFDASWALGTETRRTNGVLRESIVHPWNAGEFFQPVHIGWSGTTDEHMNADIAEIIVFTNALAARSPGATKSRSWPDRAERAVYEADRNGETAKYRIRGLQVCNNQFGTPHLPLLPFSRA